ncbi:hypothetical protein K435DRAFT_774503 [Dendrothele bispora CBS 962.96]|uniref:BTB domain-containing protein n=1 Tax=Dendrothele bispora (strain CBS 962.96) TaxID=1314807 RepID=A0A4S8MMZ5_DENBC|nr:hypothetical protein K435DRAFT_774503 [Dendrothele bispora CBS 962.96]
MSTGSDSSLVCTRVFKSFNRPTSDTTLQSSDHVLFKVHRRNLEMYSQVFADAANATATVSPYLPTPASPTGTVEQPLSNSSSSKSSVVLDLMFQYIRPLPQPDPQKVDFNVVKDVAEACSGGRREILRLFGNGGSRCANKRTHIFPPR